MTTIQSTMLVFAFCFVQFEFLYLLGSIKSLENKYLKVLDWLKQTQSCLKGVITLLEALKAAATKTKEKAE